MQIYNSMTRKKEEFKPIHEGKVGIYACGPTVYNYFHIGNARPFIIFDVLRRYLEYRGYEVTFVQNFTDIDDKMIRKANEEGVTVKEIADRYIQEYFVDAKALGIRPATVHPRATEHMPQIIAMIQKLMDNGLAYESKGDVYFRVRAFPAYGRLCGQNLEDLESGARVSVDELKEDPLDFALWKKAAPEHIMRWPSPWSDGFPGWHLECSTMGRKYLGDEFDIHGGGLDLIFPHHECEIAQSVSAQGHPAVHTWMHNNMITIAGKKMGKSYNNFITLEDFFAGNHPLLSQPFAPMVIRFFILQAHYRSTVDFSNDALIGAEKALRKMLEGYRRLQALMPAEKSTVDVPDYMRLCSEAMDDDLNTPQVIAHLFDACRIINAATDGNETLSGDDLQALRVTFKTFLEDILGIRVAAESGDGSDAKAYAGAVDLLLQVRANAKAAKDWATSDLIRDKLAELGFKVKDTRNGAEWSLE